MLKGWRGGVVALNVRELLLRLRMKRLPSWVTLRLFVVSLYVALTKLELIQTANRESM